MSKTQTTQRRQPVVPRNPYSPYIKPVRDMGISRTKQSFTDECDINFIISRFAQTGQITHLANRISQFADVDSLDFQGAMNLVKNAEELFMQIPAKIRAEFDQNPGKFLDFALNPDSAPKLAAMGLIDETDISILNPGYRPSSVDIDAPARSASPTQPVSESS